ncbi:hypothetical protein AUJ38_03325 [bacterium CG1_02_42_9]|nr:MAG: hypothetical protein AUJ38_03325 [bacterium CG1_02_42_9]
MSKSPYFQKRIVCIGGGTGTAMVLSGLKKYPVDLTAIVTMFDSGGSSGKLKKELGILPIGDVRQCLVALSDQKGLSPFFHYRFAQGSFAGHNLGNLLIAAANGLTGDLAHAIKETGKLLKIRGSVLPISLGKADIIALLKNGRKIVGEENIIQCRSLSKTGVKRLFLKPKVKVNPLAVLAIKKADLIVIGPGKFYTSIIPNFLVEGMAKAIRSSKATKIFICNLMTQIGNTDNFMVEDFIEILEKYSGKGVIDYIVFNTEKPSPTLHKAANKVFPKAAFIGYDKNLARDKRFIGIDALDHCFRKPEPADTLVKEANLRTVILHDSHKLAKAIINLL